MRHVEIPRSGDSPLRFNGELLASQSSRLVAGMEATRWHEMEIYRTDNGKYVIHLGWRTQWSREPSQDVALAAGSMQEAQEAIRAALPPIEPLAGYPLAGRLEDRRLRLEQDAMVRFDAAVLALFRQVRVPNRPNAARRVRQKPTSVAALAQ
jgi:hypothetical protein